MKFETVRFFFKVNFRFVVIQNYCYHGNVTLQLLLSITAGSLYITVNRHPRELLQSVA